MQLNAHRALPRSGSPHPVRLRTAHQHRHRPASAVPELLSTAALESGSYTALGAAGASFGLTFFVIPRFYSKNTEWKVMLPALRASGLRSVSPAEASKRSRTSVLLDVRPADKVQELAAAQAVNVPLYIPIQNWDPLSIIRRIGFAFFGVAGTELNPDFVSEVQALVPRGREVMVMCESGGSIGEKTGAPLGFQSRSLKAVYYLQQAGVAKVVHVEGGLGQWLREGLPVQGSQ
ncbi:hypothetical protein QJQ45_017388, partial [Haematococcus lacustris]